MCAFALHEAESADDAYYETGAHGARAGAVVGGGCDGVVDARVLGEEAAVP